MARRRFIERDAAISQAVAAAQPVHSIARDFGLAVSTVYGITRREGWTWHNGPRQIVRLCDLPGCTNRVPRASNRFCSHTCFVASKRLHLHQCANCPKPVKRGSAKFCSPSCYHAYVRRYWAAANGERNGRIAREAASGTPHARIASAHAIHPRTVSNVLVGSARDDDRTCQAPGCNAPTPRRHRRFCSWSCLQAWNAEQRPYCINGCGERARRRSGQFCGPVCQSVYAVRQAYARNQVRDDWIFIAAILRVPHSEIASRTGISRGYLTFILRRRRRLLLPPPTAPSGAAVNPPPCIPPTTESDR